MTREYERIAGKVALYMRVSTDHQTTDNQEQRLIEFCARRRWEIVEIYKEVESGSSLHRPELFRLLADARNPSCPWSILVAVKVDRIGRSVQDLIEIADNLAGKGKGLVFSDQDIDITSSSGRLMFNILSAFAEFERQIIIERTKAGQARARAKGRKLGRPSTHHMTREKIERLRASGLSIREIASRLNLSVGLVHKVVKQFSRVSLEEKAIVHKTEDLRT